MKVTAFIRQTAAKNNVSAMTHVYFRVRDVGVDFKAASELTINPNHWSPERQGYKSRVSLVHASVQQKFEQEVQAITKLISDTYYRGADGKWLKNLLLEYHHPNINHMQGKKGDEYGVVYQCRQYAKHHPMSESSRKHHEYGADRLARYEKFQQEVMHRRGFALRIDTLTADDLGDYHEFLITEHELFQKHKAFYESLGITHLQQRSENSINSIFKRFRTVFNWCVKNGKTKNNPFQTYELVQPIYAPPFYLTLEERDKVYYADLSEYGKSMQVYRDIFMFHCLVGCRVSDLNKLTKKNIVNGCIVYIPTKTMHVRPQPVTVPIVEKAQAIIDRFADIPEAIVPRVNECYYNRMIRRVLTVCGIDRCVPNIDKKTREPIMTRLCDVATSHTARKTFIGNLYKKTKDQSSVAVLSGHAEGSSAFNRYRFIDDEMKKETVALID